MKALSPHHLRLRPFGYNDGPFKALSKVRAARLAAGQASRDDQNTTVGGKIKWLEAAVRALR
jgi:hypothetical protein